MHSMQVVQVELSLEEDGHKRVSKLAIVAGMPVHVFAFSQTSPAVLPSSLAVSRDARRRF